MKTLVLVFHPDFASSRVNRALAERAGALGESVTVRHLDGLYPDFRIDVAAEQALLAQADRVVLQFPMRWFAAPPMLSKYEEQVLAYGWAYGPGGEALKGKELLVAVSAGGDEYGRDGANFYTVHELLRPLQATAAYCGLSYLTPFVITGAMSISDEELAARAEAYATTLTTEDLPALGQLD